MVILILFSHQPVTAQGETVVAGHDDDGVRQLSALLQCLHNPSHLSVHVFHEAEINRALLLHLVRGARGGNNPFVATCDIPRVKSGAGPEIRRER